MELGNPLSRPFGWMRIDTVRWMDEKKKMRSKLFASMRAWCLDCSLGLLKDHSHNRLQAELIRISTNNTMGSKMELSVHLEKKQLDWLETMAKKYNLPSAGKALRISIVYTKQANDDAAIFAKVQSIIDDSSALIETRQSVDDAHDKYLQDLVVKFGLGSKDKATRLILDYVMTSGDEATIFEVKRCRHGETCKNC